MTKRVLIVDDALFIRVILKKMLEEAGYEVFEASNGAEAVNIWDEVKPDLATMDITMPVLDGISAIKAIKTRDPKARIIVCSAMGQKTMIQEAIAAGAVDFLVKPFERVRVLATLLRCLYLQKLA
ncbi:response regulator [Heliobacterium undosum]|uniref:Stage 0 sporulation protein A homolog n=1 Tax=Heliomicrobium undosum TaxID=121734 RepID=A0A845KY68_9FIRM|nr:response regulator [Heliomicrobium undosum]MZP28353.1 response regulator [Heliomicrobium undosum]